MSFWLVWSAAQGCTVPLTLYSYSDEVVVDFREVTQSVLSSAFLEG